MAVVITADLVDGFREWSRLTALAARSANVVRLRFCEAQDDVETMSDIETQTFISQLRHTHAEIGRYLVPLDLTSDDATRVFHVALEYSNQETRLDMAVSQSDYELGQIHYTHHALMRRFSRVVWEICTDLLKDPDGRADMQGFYLSRACRRCLELYGNAVNHIDMLRYEQGNAVAWMESQVATTKPSADTEKFLAAMKSTRCGTSRLLAQTQWEGTQSDRTIDDVNLEFRRKYSRMLGKTAAERDKEWQRVSKAARRIWERYNGAQ